MKVYEIEPGSHIVTVVTKMVALANESDEPVTAEFNQTGIVANPGSYVEEVVSYYYKQQQTLMKFRHARNKVPT